MKVFKKLFSGFKKGLQKGAYDGTIQDLFQDYYAERGRIYKLNFVRGIFFGLGSALGGTVVLALVIWILSFFVNFPVVGDYLKNTQNSIEQRHQTK